MTTVEPYLHRGDVDQAVVDRARATGRIGWDIETTGLDWRKDKIGTCQLAIAGQVAVIQLEDWVVPDHLRELLQDSAILKIFHHAPFDLRFMTHHWKTEPANVACTKIASKILNPAAPHPDHSLKPVLERYLGVVIDKGQQLSDWSRTSLSEAQVAYAAADVQHLSDLYDCLMGEADRADVASLISASYRYLPTRVSLDLLGPADVFAY